MDDTTQARSENKQIAARTKPVERDSTSGTYKEKDTSGHAHRDSLKIKATAALETEIFDKLEQTADISTISKSLTTPQKTT